jgi:hypothetical protein
VNRFPPPPPGTWRRDDGQGSFTLRALESPAAGTPLRSALLEPVVTPPTPSSRTLMTCPYGDEPPFTYLSPEGAVAQEILDHIQAAHPLIWVKMQADIVQDTERIEEEFT